MSAERAPLWPLGFYKGVGQLIFTSASTEGSRAYAVPCESSYLAIFPGCFMALRKFLGGMNTPNLAPSPATCLTGFLRMAGGGGSSRWASYQTRLRNFLGCPQPRALRNTKILRTALGLLQQGRAFRFKRRK